MISPDVIAALGRSSYSFVLVAEYNGRIIAIIAVRNSNLLFFFVDSEFQGSGVGNKLIK